MIREIQTAADRFLQARSDLDTLISGTNDPGLVGGSAREVTEAGRLLSKKLAEYVDGCLGETHKELEILEPEQLCRAISNLARRVDLALDSADWWGPEVPGLTRNGEELKSIQPIVTAVLSSRSHEVPIGTHELLLQFEITKSGGAVDAGLLVEGVGIAWDEILRQVALDSDFLFKVHWRKLEEIVAAAYEREGWSEVILTPRSADQGRDIIATRIGVGTVRLFDQVKAYKRGSRVSAEQVSSLVGRLRGNVSKGVVTTTAEFAPGVRSAFEDLIPFRLELRDGKGLAQWLTQLRYRRNDNGCE